jgi:hypothetical protein
MRPDGSTPNVKSPILTATLEVHIVRLGLMVSVVVLASVGCALPQDATKEGIYYVGSCSLSGLHVCTDYFDPPRESALISSCGTLGGSWATQECTTTGQIGTCEEQRTNGAYQIDHIFVGAYATWPTDCTNGGGTWTPAP